MRKKYIGSSFSISYYAYEILVLVILVTSFCFIMPKVDFEILADLVCLGAAGYWMFILERKLKIVLDRDSNKINIIEKSLFQEVYRLKKHVVLDTVERAELVVIPSRKSYTCVITLSTASGEIDFLKLDCKKEACQNMVNRINDFIIENKFSESIEHTPFVSRLIGIACWIGYLVAYTSFLG